MGMRKELKFIVCQETWRDKDGNTSANHIEIMEEHGYSHCRLSFYPNENVMILSNVYVDSIFRERGYCHAMLDYMEMRFRHIREHILVYVDSWAPDYVRQMYQKRGYIIQSNN